jgi:hypothetical protein
LKGKDVESPVLENEKDSTHEGGESRKVGGYLFDLHRCRYFVIAGVPWYEEKTEWISVGIAGKLSGPQFRFRSRDFFGDRAIDMGATRLVSPREAHFLFHELQSIEEEVDPLLKAEEPIFKMAQGSEGNAGGRILLWGRRIELLDLHPMVFL